MCDSNSFYVIQCDSSNCLFLFPQLMAATDRINSLREEQEQLRQENESILQSSQKKEEVTNDVQETTWNIKGRTFTLIVYFWV